MGITKIVNRKLVSYFTLQLSVRSQLMVGFQLIQKRVSGNGKYPATGLEQTLSFYLGFLEVALSEQESRAGAENTKLFTLGWCRKHKTFHPQMQELARTPVVKKTLMMRNQTIPLLR